MLTKRIIPCLDVKGKQVVKGKYFENLSNVGDPVEMAQFYETEGADELVLLDIAATLEEKRPFLDVVEQVAYSLSIPLTVGGGIKTLGDIRALLKAGVDKISINTAALLNPWLIEEAATSFGSQCVILAVDAKSGERGWEVFSHCGTHPTGREVLEWCLEAEKLGAGEILVTSIDRDGAKMGYDLELISLLSSRLSIPVIASGGVGRWEDIRDAFKIGQVDAALAASLFHFGYESIRELKQRLSREGIEVRQ